MSTPVSMDWEAAFGGEFDVSDAPTFSVASIDATVERGCIANKDLPEGSVLLRTLPAISTLSDSAVLACCTVCLREASSECEHCGACAFCPNCERAGRSWHEVECGWYTKVGMREMLAGGVDTELLRLALRYTLCQYHGPMLLRENDLHMLNLLTGPLSKIPSEAFAMMTKIARAAAAVSHPGAPANSELLRRRAKELVGVMARRMYNALGIPKGRGSLVVPSASFFNHHCQPNCGVTVNTSGGGWLVVKTLREVSAGEQLCISYVDTSKPAEMRRAALQQIMHFDCECPRCAHELQLPAPGTDPEEGSQRQQQSKPEVCADVFYPDPLEHAAIQRVRAAKLARGEAPEAEGGWDPEGVHVAASGIEGAGQGLFASRDWKKGQLMGHYTGAVLSTAQVLQMAVEDKGYLLRAGANTYVDAAQTECLGRFINDAVGSEFETNVVFDKQPAQARAAVYCLRDIAAGEELLVSYGRQYWRTAS